MTIKTRSVFYYLGDINEENNLINFIEPNKDNIELTGTLRVGTYTVTDIGTEFQRALEDAGQNEYSVVVDRDTRVITVSADDDFDLLVTTGSNAGLSSYSLLGFTSDKTGSDSYVGDLGMGTEYLPQFKLQSYVDAINFIQGIEPSVNESASGVLEIVTFGKRAFYEFNIKYITDRTRVDGSHIENDPNALQSARDFLTFLIDKGPLEFMPDRSDRATFDKVILERTREDSKGTSFRLRELLNEDLEGYFETGTLRFRRVDS